MWFRELVGFEESSPDDVRAQLHVLGDRMTSAVNGREMGCGVLEVTSLAELRHNADRSDRPPSQLREEVGDAGALHNDPANAGATFQVASQFNLLEMVSPNVTPEAGVDGYENDRTQGPVCAVACGAGTIYRNYFVEVDGQPGQRHDAQIDCLAPVGQYLFGHDPVPWTMQNGYAMFDRAGLEATNQRLDKLDDLSRDEAMAQLRVGVHRGVEVTTSTDGHHVTQVYCSALPVAYNQQPVELFEPLARLVLDGAYEATLRAAAAQIGETANNTVYLTLVGGGVFGNDEEWILDAIRRAVTVVDGLDVAVVSYRSSNPSVAALVRST